jgi:hypothetical protein
VSLGMCGATKMMPYKFLTGSGMGPLYKYLRYEILTTVGAVTEIGVQDTGGTMKKIFPPDLINAHYRVSSPQHYLDEGGGHEDRNIPGHIQYENPEQESSSRDLGHIVMVVAEDYTVGDITVQNKS